MGRAAGWPRKPAGKGAATALLAFLMAPAAAQGAGTVTDMTLTPPHASAEHTLINLGGISLRMETNSIVLGAADTDSASLPLASSFASARSSGVFAVAGSAKATLSLTFDIGEALFDQDTRVPLPLAGSWAHHIRAGLAIGASGKLGLNIGSSFGFASATAPDHPSGGWSFSTSAKPWKRMSLHWHWTF